MAATAAAARAEAVRTEEEQKAMIRPTRRPAVKPLRLRSPSSSSESEEQESPSTRYRGDLISCLHKAYYVVFLPIFYLLVWGGSHMWLIRL